MQTPYVSPAPLRLALLALAENVERRNPFRLAAGEARPALEAGKLSVPRKGFGEKVLALSHRCWRTRGIGDFWQHMLVAEGAFDIALDPIVGLWDVAALIPIIEEAGGRWSTLDGRAQADGGSFVCTNGMLHDEVLGALA